MKDYFYVGLHGSDLTSLEVQNWCNDLHFYIEYSIKDYIYSREIWGLMYRLYNNL